MNSEQRQTEENTGRGFLKKLGLPSDTLVPSEPPEPDSRFEVDGRWIGLEITKFSFPNPEKVQNNFRRLQENAVKDAEQLFLKRGGPPLYVVVEFKDHLGPQNKNESNGVFT